MQRPQQTPEDRAAINERDAQRAAVLAEPISLPWIVGNNGFDLHSASNFDEVATFFGKQSAAYAVRACNNHYKLVEALTNARDTICAQWCDEMDLMNPHCEECDRASKALAEAEAA